MFRMKVAPAPEPVRPSHYGEDQNERVPRDAPDVDYPHGTDEPGIDFGWTVPSAAPTPVYLTEPPPSDRTRRDWTPQTYALTPGRLVQIASANRNRTRLVITNNDDANNALLTRRPVDNPNTNGYVLAFGDDITMHHNESVWATCAATPAGDSSCSISVYSEYEMTDDD